MAKRDKEYKQPLKELTQEEIEKIFSEDNPEPDFSEEYKKKMKPLLKPTKKTKKNIKTICIIAVAAVSWSLVSWNIPTMRKLALKFISDDMGKTSAVVKVKNSEICADYNKCLYRPVLGSSFNVVNEVLDDNEYTMWLETANGEDIVYKQQFEQPEMLTQDMCLKTKIVETQNDMIYVSVDSDDYVHLNWANESGGFFVQGNANEKILLDLYDSLKKEALP